MNYSTSLFKSVVDAQIPLFPADFAWQNAAAVDFYARDWVSETHQEPVGLDIIEPTAHVSHACSGGHVLISPLCSSCGHAWCFPGRCSDRLCKVTGDLDRHHWHSYWSDILSGRRQVVANGCYVPLKMRSPHHLVLSVESTMSLRDAVVTVNRAFKKLRRSALFVRGVVTDQNSRRHPVDGGVVVGETTVIQFNDGVFFHYHLHVLVDCYFLPMKELAAVWCRLTDGKGRSGGVNLTDVPSTDSGICRITEYVGKPVVFSVADCLSTDSYGVREAAARRADLPLAVAESYRNVMSGRRLVWSFGRYYAFTLRVKRPLTCPVCRSEDVHVYHIAFSDGETDSIFMMYDSFDYPELVDGGIP